MVLTAYHQQQCMKYQLAFVIVKFQQSAGSDLNFEFYHGLQGPCRKLVHLLL
jgi:hypothetical protein